MWKAVSERELAYEVVRHPVQAGQRSEARAPAGGGAGDAAGNGTGHDSLPHSEEVFTLLMYTSCQRHPDNFSGKPLLWARYELMVYVWMAAWPYLTPVSRAMPPSHLQLLFYYWLKGAEMVEHQDNSEGIGDIRDMADGASPGL